MPTALAHIYSEDGLVIAADGLNIITGSNEPVSTHVQKIFQLSGVDRDVACSFMGMATLFNDADEIVFDFISACRNAARVVESIPAKDANEFAAQVSPLIQQDLVAVKESGKLSQYPSREQRDLGRPGRVIVSIRFDGYFNGQPFRAGVRFYHIDQNLSWEVISHHLDRSHKTILLGLDKVANLLLETESPGLERYRTDACRLMATRFIHPDTPMGLKDAIDAAQNFIGACSDPLAKEIEGGTYRQIGGEPHIATITPKDGFQWAVRPKQFDSL